MTDTSRKLYQRAVSNSEGKQRDEFDEFMTALENAGILRDWTDFMKKEEEK